MLFDKRMACIATALRIIFLDVEPVELKARGGNGAYVFVDRLRTGKVLQKIDENGARQIHQLSSK